MEKSCEPQVFKVLHFTITLCLLLSGCAELTVFDDYRSKPVSKAETEFLRNGKGSTEGPCEESDISLCSGIEWGRSMILQCSPPTSFRLGRDDRDPIMTYQNNCRLSENQGFKDSVRFLHQYSIDAEYPSLTEALAALGFEDIEGIKTENPLSAIQVDPQNTSHVLETESILAWIFNKTARADNRRLFISVGGRITGTAFQNILAPGIKGKYFLIEAAKSFGPPTLKLPIDRSSIGPQGFSADVWVWKSEPYSRVLIAKRQQYQREPEILESFKFKTSLLNEYISTLIMARKARLLKQEEILKENEQRKVKDVKI